MWSAVVGLGEKFSVVELLSFPIFVLKNHGERWNQMGWTVWLSFVIFAPLTVWAIRRVCKGLGWPVLELDYTVSFQRGVPYVSCRFQARELLYELAVLAFVGTILEMTIHLVYAQWGLAVDYALWVGLVGVILFANGLPLFQVLSTWAALQYTDAASDASRRAKFRCSSDYLACSNSVWWAPVEIVTGVSYFFLFGAGFYLGPTAIVLAGCLRLGAACAPLRRRMRPRSVPVGVSFVRL